jgi:hypothetical protein
MASALSESSEALPKRRSKPTHKKQSGLDEIEEKAAKKRVATDKKVTAKKKKVSQEERAAAVSLLETRPQPVANSNSTPNGRAPVTKEISAHNNPDDQSANIIADLRRQLANAQGESHIQ